MGALHSAVLMTVGFWLLVYRLALRFCQCRGIAEPLTTACSGLSLALVAPLLPWPPAGWRVASLGLLGMLTSFVHPAFTALVVAGTLGLGAGGFLWQLGLCRLTELDAVKAGVLSPVADDLHPLLLALTAVVFVGLFVCTPGIAGPGPLTVFLVPCLGSLLLTAGFAGLLGGLGQPLSAAAGAVGLGLAPGPLFAEVPCAALAGNVARAWGSLMGWLLLAAAGVTLQLLLNRQAAKAEVGAGAPGGDLTAVLLPHAGGKDASLRPSASLRQDEEFGDRFRLITKAIFADEGADQSHLTETERKLVEVCRKDEFERDRVLWGGGLI